MTAAIMQNHRSTNQEAEHDAGNQSDRRSKANLKVALQLAAAGISIFPACATPDEKGWDKKPVITGWRENATTDPEQIKRWWTAHPGAIPGIELSKVSLLVIDADRHGGPDGVAEFEALVARHGALPLGPLTETAGGGLHYFFKQPLRKRLGNRKGALPPGVDVRGDGGWIVAPGSTRSDGKLWKPLGPPLDRTFLAGTIPVVPDWVVDLIQSNVVRIDGGNPAHLQAERGESVKAQVRERAYASAALNGCADELRQAMPGRRNEILNSVAFRMGRMIASGWIEKPVVADALWAACEANGLVGDDGEDSVQRSLASGIEAGMRVPHAELPRTDTKAPANDNTPPKIRVRWDGEGKFEPPLWLVRDLITESAVGLVIGESQAAKSFVAVYLAICMALGVLFFTKKVKQGGVLFVAAEAAATIHERIEAIRRGFVLPLLSQSETGSTAVDPQKLPIAVLESIPDLATAAGAKELETSLKQMCDQMKDRFGMPVRAVIIDTIGAAFGITNWNDAGEARRVTSTMARLKDATGATIIGIHHHGKTIERGATGSFVFTADPDFVVSIFREADNTGHVGRRYVCLTKSRRADTGWSCDFTLVPVSLGQDSDGADHSSPYVQPIPDTVGNKRTRGRKEKGDNRSLLAFKDSMIEAITTCGSIQRVRGDGPAIRAVRRGDVRAEFARRYTADSDDEKTRRDTIRKAFTRGLEHAIKARWACEGNWSGEDWLWLASQPDTGPDRT